MIITCYQNASASNVVHKQLTPIAELTGTLKDGSDVTNPAILYENFVCPTFNYVYIGDFHRYYYLASVKNVSAKLWQLNFHCDVLMSFWDDFKNDPCIVDRNETVRTRNLVDDQLYVTADSLYGVAKFSQQPLMTGTALKRYVMVLQGAGPA